MKSILLPPKKRTFFLSPTAVATATPASAPLPEESVPVPAVPSDRVETP
jgi:hypothetical protein